MTLNATIRARFGLVRTLRGHHPGRRLGSHAAGSAQRASWFDQFTRNTLRATAHAWSPTMRSGLTGALCDSRQDRALPLVVRQFAWRLERTEETWPTSGRRCASLPTGPRRPDCRAAGMGAKHLDIVARWPLSQRSGRPSTPGNQFLKQPGSGLLKMDADAALQAWVERRH